jgi:hypothetical protein
VRRAGAGLVHVDDELVAKRAVQDFVRGGNDRVANRAFEASERDVREGRRLLDEDRRRDDLRRGAEAADGKVFEGAGRLDAVIGVGGDREFSERVALNASHVGLRSTVCGLRFDRQSREGPLDRRLETGDRRPRIY